MNIVGFDLAKRKSQICVMDEKGTVVSELRVMTTREDIVEALKPFGPCKILIEASTSAEWVARSLEGNGHAVVVADPRFSLMYAQTSKRIKTDKRDAQALATALRLGAYRPAHRMSDEARRVHGQLLVRKSTVAVRTKLILQVRALSEREGIILPKCATEHFHECVAGAFQGMAWLGDVLAPLVEQIAALTEKIALLDKIALTVAKNDPRARNLMTVRGVGPITALAFVAVIDDPTRFDSAQQLSSYLGLVPGQYNSGDSRRAPGAITKTGDKMLRYLLVEASLTITKRTAPDSSLKRHFAKIVAKGGAKKGKKKALVAIARRLSRILWAMLRDDKPFDELRTRPLVQGQPAVPAMAAA